MGELEPKFFSKYLTSEKEIVLFCYRIAIGFLVLFLVLAAVSAALERQEWVVIFLDCALVALILPGVVRTAGLAIFYFLQKEKVFAVCALATVLIFIAGLFWRD